MTDPTQKNVVQIEGYFKPYNAVKLMHDCRELTSRHLTASLSKMMGQVDDALFELAEKAENNSIQSLYFDAMREVRIKKKDIEALFCSQFNHQCRALFDPEENTEIGKSNPEPAADNSLQLQGEGELSLIENNQLETSLAVSNMVAKIAYLCKDELFALNKRIGILLNETRLEDERNPLSPHIICNAFEEASGVLDSDIKIRLIILKLFEKYVIQDLKAVYSEINTFLAQNNILPKISYVIQKNAEAASALNELMPGVNSDETAPGMDLFATLQNLLQSGGTASNAYATGSGQPILQTGGMLSNLTLLQQGDMAALNSHHGIPIDSTMLTTANESILRNVKTLGILGNLSGDEDFTIDIVAMMFDYILDDKAIPNRMKAIIGRLQIPVLKAVLLDKTFFAKKSHPVRKLLDTLSQAAIGLTGDPQEDDDLYAKAEEIVQKIIMEFDDDLSLFSTALAELKEFLEKFDLKIRERLEESSRILQEKERLAYASRQAEDEIKRCLAGRKINEVVSTFINEHWHTLLVTTLLLDDQNTESWQAQLNTMALLIWSITPKKTPEERRELVAALPGLLEQLRQGMEVISMPQQDRDCFLGKLANCHSAAVSTKNRDNNAEKTLAQADEETDGIITPSPTEDMNRGEIAPPPENQAETMTSDNTQLKTAECAAEKPQNAGPALPATKTTKTTKTTNTLNSTDIMAQIRQGTVEVEEITLIESGGLHSTTPAARDDQSMALARDLKKGTWLVFQQENGETTHEKLTWINSITGIYMFTNRCGENTRNITRLQLADDFRNGIAEIIEDTPLVDRAVSSMIDNLRRA